MVIMVVALSMFFSSVLPSTVPVGGIATAAEHITLTWAADPQTTQTITWQTEVTNGLGRVQYAPAVEAKSFPHNARSLSAGVEELATNWGNVSIHSVTLTGLKPGTTYIYRVGEEKGWSDLRTFTTASTHVSKFKFLVFGDSQSNNYNVWRSTLHRAYQTNPEAVFFTNIGDLVDRGQDYAQWKAWFDAAQGVMDIIPVMPVTGNHESYTPEGRFSMPIFFSAQLKLPLNGPEGLKGQVYSFDYGDVHFSMLDSQEGEERRFVPAMLDKQEAWLENDLRATNKKWKIVCFHRPPYNNKEKETNQNIRKAFVPVFDKYHVDVVFTGHDHVYARTYPLYGDEVVDSPGKGTIYVATGRSGTKSYRDSLAKDRNIFFYNPLDEPNYVTVEVSGNSLTVKAFKQSGILIDNWMIDKAAGGK
ncbi:MAG: metallophosphoesterase [Firmicutes bacterium]|nr:metallophosphoesterase [Bacillota bacterium]